MNTISTDNIQRNMHQLVFEFLQQSFDESREGFCTEIGIELLPDCKLRISDNGRGLPLSRDMRASKAVLDKILAGRHISNAEYSQMGDLMQANLQTVNSLCEELQVIVSRNGSQFQQDYIRGIAQHDLTISDSSDTQGTTITMKPDSVIFGNTDFSREIIQAWLDENAPDNEIVRTRFI